MYYYLLPISYGYALSLINHANTMQIHLTIYLENYSYIGTTISISKT